METNDLNVIPVQLDLNLQQTLLMIMALDAGMINLHNVQSVLSQVFFMKESEISTNDLLKKIVEIRGIIVSKIQEIKPELKIVDKDENKQKK